MAQIRIDLSAPPIDGMDIKFQAPCDCTEVAGMVIYYPAGDGSTATKELTFRDAHGNNLAGIGNLFAQGVYVKVIVDLNNGYAYLQNADTNGYLNSAIIGTYIHDGENLTGSGENGKFKATVSGTISTINVNGVSCSVKCGEESSMDLIAGCWYTFILDGDTVNFSSGGAGDGGLNFAVVGGTAEPVSPKENTIWVNTDTDITSYIFSATEPESPFEGLVWISTGTSSPVEFNALKKNGIQVYPISAKQYVSGAWVTVKAMSYQGGAWCSWITYLYDAGDECADVTGGWVAVGKKASSSGSSTATAPTITRNETNIYAKFSAYNQSGIIYAQNPVSISGYSRLRVEGTFKNASTTTSVNHVRFVVWSAIGTYYDDNVVAVTGISGGTTVTEFEIDVSSLDGEYYVGFVLNSSGTGQDSYIQLESCYLE